MIEGIIGKPGAGKTYVMTTWILEAVARYERGLKRGTDPAKLHQPFSNYNVKGAYKLTVDMLLHPEALPFGAELFVDELQMWLPSRAFQDVPIEIFRIFSQGRHCGIDLAYTVQHERRIDRIVRELTTYLYMTQAVKLPWSDRPLAFIADKFDADSMAMARIGSDNGYFGRSVILFSQRVASAYHSWGDTIAEAEYLTKGRKKRGSDFGSAVGGHAGSDSADAAEGWPKW